MFPASVRERKSNEYTPMPSGGGEDTEALLEYVYPVSLIGQYFEAHRTYTAAGERSRLIHSRFPLENLLQKGLLACKGSGGVRMRVARLVDP
ncbi:hypothetical protein NDU88_005745 [Pleurodeles waltl]|uniref:Uncharacterized protein n=1 Tax=Pleurodeles waltl TaxID=8319 RepID=A0AAV7LPY8_PLEWA|nr:hypothetical protein NDU88_005745 [Pleurodeles waltl]